MSQSVRNQSAYEEAAEWVLVLQQPEVTDEEARRFNEWLSALPNRHAFDLALRAWEQSGALHRVRRRTAAEIADDDYDGSEPVAVHLARQRERKARPRGLSWMVATSLAIGALLVVAIVTLSTGRFSAQSETHVTGIAQHREVRLSDGSLVTLGAQTAISVRFAREQRTIVLDHGMALFEVAHDKTRPFVVAAARGQAAALGTVFSVRRDQDVVMVSVADGRVQVDERAETLPSLTSARASLRSERTAVLVKGERVSYGAESQLGAVERTDPSLAMAWRSGLLAYRDEPLLQVIRDLNRYSQHSIVLGDRAVEQIRFTGTVQIDHGQQQIDQWVTRLQSILPLEVVTGDGRLLIRSQPEPL